MRGSPGRRAGVHCGIVNMSHLTAKLDVVLWVSLKDLGYGR